MIGVLLRFSDHFVIVSRVSNVEIRRNSQVADAVKYTDEQDTFFFRRT